MSTRKSTAELLDEQDKMIHDLDQVASQEARNGLLQFDEVLRLVELHVPAYQFKVTPDLIRDLNRLAIQGIRYSAGQYRQNAIAITNTPHTPPAADQVPLLVFNLCKYVNEHWTKHGDDVVDALHIAAYLMWRLNWIHPFRDGNGRTSRAVSYLVLCTRLGQLLPGTPTIADQIVDNREPYYAALDAADAAWKEGVVDVSAMENLIRMLLLRQLSSVST